MFESHTKNKTNDVKDGDEEEEIRIIWVTQLVSRVHYPPEMCQKCQKCQKLIGTKFLMMI